jgi:hypothetical protein
MLEIRYRDIDPDTGNITRDEMVCQCPTEMLAKWVYSAIVKESLDSDDPNREFYIKSNKPSLDEILRDAYLENKNEKVSNNSEN